jgi:hypothetical protein
MLLIIDQVSKPPPHVSPSPLQQKSSISDTSVHRTLSFSLSPSGFHCPDYSTSEGLSSIDRFPTADSMSSPLFSQRKACQVPRSVAMNVRWRVVCGLWLHLGRHWLPKGAGLGRAAGPGRAPHFAQRASLSLWGNSSLFLFPNRFQMNSIQIFIGFESYQFLFKVRF